MRSLITKITLVFALLFSFVIPAHAAAETYNFDPMHTYLIWHINHFGFSIQAGKFSMIDGTLVVDEAKPQNSKVTVTIPMDKLSTGIPKLDEHLASGDFFNVEKFPTATFVSNKVVVSGKNTGKVYGILTLLGISKPVTLDVKMLKVGMYPMKNIKSIGFSATTEFKRSEFGMDKYLPALADEVKIDIGVEANLAK